MMRGVTALGSAICLGVGTVVGFVVEGIVNFARKFDWSSVDWKKIVPVIPVPMVSIYPHF
jgi:hypothetical protein